MKFEKGFSMRLLLNYSLWEPHKLNSVLIDVVSDRRVAYCSTTEIKEDNKISYESKIRIHQNPFMIFTRESLENLYRDEIPFLQELNVDNTDLAISIMLLLHELGHISRIDKYAQYTHSLRSLKCADKSIDFCLDAICSDDKLISQEMYYHFATDYEPSELYADKFVYLKFPGIWNKLKEINFFEKKINKL